ncbi:MAG: ribosomal protein S18-alanine N-acetyltransferase [Candidatus Binatus sp.]|uniref:ribosomal protein S18-alanine N-acetyltransferase n=1 Tax=Candidatus Binatus sp. TaxID=2811406 RepID=UPI00271613B4|nr:ribosomal protein S18-alanine N-acetyltransferase [Candidatus Binatus sp.]MDO8431654.1 ribosomal protein S18-alanine N-acetyltransferase [Candidatus Binatus sp.]
MAIQIRDATSRDLPHILEIERLSFPSPWTLASFKRELTLPFSRVIVAISEDYTPNRGATSPILGFLCRWLIADECHILNIAVHPDARRLGVGAMLMIEAIREAQAERAELVTLEVRRSNLAARQLYRKFGFEERRLKKNYYGPGEDAIIMELRFD